MYLYTARFSRRHVTVSGALVWEKIQTLESSLLSWVTAGCLSRGGRRDYLSERGLSHRVLYLKCILPLRKATVWRDTNQKKTLWFNFILTQWNWCKRANPTARHSSLWDGKGRGFDVRREKKRSLTPSESRSWSWCSDWARSVKGVEAGPRAKGFNCGAGCTFHSAQCRAGSWRYSGGRTTWRRRRQEPRGRPWPRNPESWRAAHPLYLEGQQRKNRILPQWRVEVVLCSSLSGKICRHLFSDQQLSGPTPLWAFPLQEATLQGLLSGWFSGADWLIRSCSWWHQQSI